MQVLDADLQTKIGAELHRVEENTLYSSKAQYNASDRYSGRHVWLGVPAAALSAAAGAASFSGQWELVAGMMSIAVAILASLQTFMKPSEQASAHKAAGDQFLALRNDARVMREIKLPLLTDPQETVTALETLVKRQNDLNASSPQVARRDFERARNGIEGGEATNVIDAQGAKP
ncbi:SLATT domain-containing protein [Devosia ginsengisoli]|uniref:SLATT domain-containing protein n=1 Tax=Devosia ginsengisoli TaxID=400770 RepID=UPI0026F2DEA6|nr:SLATT domain-containing protein [Devosia ginsengisoli]MCR6672706.1 SLATT domain-containing protein [Devosia ginsengisoli]